MTRKLLDGGVTLVAQPVMTPRRSINSRVEAPAGQQIKLFQEAESLAEADGVRVRGRHTTELRPGEQRIADHVNICAERLIAAVVCEDRPRGGNLGTVRVVSLNAWCGGMLEPLVRWLPVCGADVLCVQEVTWTPGHDGWVTYVDPDRVLMQRSSLFEDLRRSLPEHQSHFFTCDTGPVLCEDGVVRRQHFGIATLLAPHLAIVGSEASFVHGTFAHHDAWPSEDRGRVAHAVRVADVDGRCVTVAHFHGVRMASGKGDIPERRRQAEQLAALVGRVRAPDDLVVVTGDLNLLPDSDTFELLGRAGLTDLVGTGDTRTSSYTKSVRHADYLLVSDPGAVASFEILAEPEVSDHRPLVLDLFPAVTG